MNHIRTRLAVVLLAITAVLCSAGCQTSFRRTPDRITLDAETVDLDGTWCRQYFMVAAMIDGHGPFRLLLDTGATNTIITPAMLDRMGVVPDSTSQKTRGGGGKTVTASGQYRIGSLRSGGVTISSFDTLVMDLTKFAPAIGPIDGILGYTAFRGATLTIDYPAAVVQVSNQRLTKPANESGTPASWFSYGTASRPQLVAEIDGRALHVLIDSGSGGRFAIKALDSLPMHGAPVLSAASINLDQVVIKRMARLRTDLTCGHITLIDPVVSSDQKGNKVGTEVMQHYRWTFDTAAKLVRVDMGPSVIEPTVETTLGFAGAMTSDGLKVIEIDPASDASRQGLRRGDLITRVNGVHHADFACEGLSDAVGESNPIRYRILRDGAALDIVANDHVAVGLPE